MKNTKKESRLYAQVGVTILAFAALPACSGAGSGGAISLGANAPSTNGASQFNVGIYATAGGSNLVAANADAQFITGQIVTISATSTAGGAMTMTCTNTDIPAATSTITTLAQGANSYTAPSPGDYSCSISQTGYSGQSTFQMSVACANPTPLNLSGASVSASAAGGASTNNLFNFSASGIASGQGPYTCAWDFLGDGIEDTLFTPCGSGPQNIYVPYVGNHRIGLIVRDSCNTVATTYSTPVNFAYAVPAMGAGNTFIYATTSASGSAASDPRVNQPGTGGITYLVTNQGPSFLGVVSPLFSAGTTTSSFSIKSALKYNGADSATQGAEFDISGIPGTVNAATMTSSLSTGTLTLPMKVSFTTDQAGDAEPQVTYEGSCNLTNAHAVAQLTAGTPCTTGETGDQNMEAVEVWGNYTCTLAAPDGSTVTLTGELDGLYNSQDSCVGGGGQEGGGVVPIGL